MDAGREAILIVDDDASYRSAMRELFGRVGLRTLEASTGLEALACARRETPGGVLLDVHLPGMTGYEVCRELRDAYGDALPIVFVTGRRVEAADRIAGLYVGADDYLIKPVNSDELIARVRRMLARSRADSSTCLPGLTNRESEVLRLLAEGLDQKAIAHRLVISPNTVATHIQRILPKLGVRNRTQAVVHAYREGLVEYGRKAGRPLA
jgi:DNA-binding NarL/FixJ family response regulator